MSSEKSPFERMNHWIRNSVTVKLGVIGILMLLMLIPSSMIESIIYEREMLNNRATSEVSSKWAKSQQINGPILTVPLLYEWEEDGKKHRSTRNWYLLPEELSINGEVEPKSLNRGIYEIIVYNSNLQVSGNFDFTKTPDHNNLKEIQYDKAFLTIGVTDLRGIKSQIKVNWGDRKLGVKPGSKISDHIYSGVTVDIPGLQADSSKTINFNFELDLQGSRNISFVPIGSTTKVDLKSSWHSPKFDGNFLPDHREVDDSGFVAEWKILQLNRNFPQSWIGTNHSQKILESSFGVDLIVPLDNYQKSMRSAKYSMMTVVLTFLIFFLVEILNKRKIHPFQYALVGMALCLFYVLLVSITEHIGFNQAYGISTAGIVGMIALYSISVFRAKKLTALLMVTLVGIYGFLFVTLQLSDYALLMGSIGLALILGATMFFTRKIDWYNLNRGSEESDTEEKMKEPSPEIN